MRPGIKNPFAKPKPRRQDFQASTGVDPLNTEYVEKPKSSIRLDGGTYVIVLRDTDLEDIPTRLGKLFEAIQEDHRRPLRLTFGIALCPTPADASALPDDKEWRTYRALTTTHVALPTPQGTLYICTDEENEDEAFRRMGRALYKLPVRGILRDQNINLIVRP